VGYDRRRFDSLLIARLLDDWRSLLEAIIEGVSDPEQRLLDLSSDASLTHDSSRRLSAHVPGPEDVETQFMF